jgi:hypothetical protein
MPPSGNARIAASARRRGASLEITGGDAIELNFSRAGIINTLSLLKHAGRGNSQPRARAVPSWVFRRRLGVGLRGIGAEERERVRQDGNPEALQDFAFLEEHFAGSQSATLAREDSRFELEALERCCRKGRRGEADRIERAAGGFRLRALIDFSVDVRLRERGEPL